MDSNAREDGTNDAEALHVMVSVRPVRHDSGIVTVAYPGERGGSDMRSLGKQYGALMVATWKKRNVGEKGCS